MMRILYNNVADAAASVVASSTAGSLGTANLLTDIKRDVWRSTSTTWTLTITWSTSQILSMAALPFCNFTSTATIRARAYTEASDPSPAVDSGSVLACAYAPLASWPWGEVALGVNAFSYGGGAYARVYFGTGAFKKLVLSGTDADNAAGYVEAARLVTGAYWQPERMPQQGELELIPRDLSINTRNDDGDLRTEQKPRTRSVPVPLRAFTPADRARIYEILRGNGISRPVFLSMFPNRVEDPQLEQMYQIWGKLANGNSAMANPARGTYAVPLEVEEM